VKKRLSSELVCNTTRKIDPNTRNDETLNSLLVFLPSLRKTLDTKKILIDKERQLLHNGIEGSKVGVR